MNIVSIYFAQLRIASFPKAELRFDTCINNLVWRGSMADPVDAPARLGKQFAESAKDILDKFPKEKTGS